MAETNKIKQEDEYLKSLSGVSPQNASVVDNNESNDSTVDYYENLKNESYKTMLSKEVQAANAQDQALKYTKNGLMANGYGTQGIAESTKLGIGNAYLSGLKNAQTAYATDINSINQQQRAEQLQANETNFQSLTTLMSNASSESQLNEMMKNYGYATYDEKTKTYSLNEEKLATLDENTRNQLITLYNMYDSQLKTNDFLSANTVNGTGFRDAATAIQNVAVATGETGKIKSELAYIFNEDFMAGKQDGYCVKLVGGNDKEYAYMIYYNGSWYQTTASVYANTKSGQKTIIDK